MSITHESRLQPVVSAQRPFWASPTFLAYLGFTWVLVMFRGPTNFFPMYLTDRRFSIADIGWLVGAAGIGAIIAQPFSAHLTQRAHRVALTLGVVLYAGSIGYLATPGLSSNGLFALMLLQGAMNAICTNCINTLVVEATPKEQRSKGIALYWATFQLSSLLGPTLAEVSIHRQGYSTTFVWFAWGLGSICFGLGLLLRRTPAEPQESSARASSSAQGFFREISKPGAVLFALTFFVISVAWWAQGDFLTAFARSRGIEHVSSFFVGYFLLMFPSRLFLSHLPDRWGRHFIAAMSMLLYAAFFIALIFTRTSPALGLLGMVAGASNCLSWPALYAISYERISVAAYATAYTAFLLSAARWVAGLLFGGLGTSLGFEGMFIAASLLSAVSSIPLFFWARHERSKVTAAVS